MTVSDYSKLTPVIMPQTNKSLQLNVNVNGVSQPMVFQLLDNLAPNTAAYIESLVQSGFYDGLSIYRNGMDSSGNPFVIQGGNDPPTGPIKTDQSSDCRGVQSGSSIYFGRHSGHGAHINPQQQFNGVLCHRGACPVFRLQLHDLRYSDRGNERDQHD